MIDVYWNMKGLLLLVVTGCKALHFKIQKLKFSVPKIGKEGKHGEIRINKEWKIVESEMFMWIEYAENLIIS